jgi:hypothetical protein
MSITQDMSAPPDHTSCTFASKVTKEHVYAKMKDRQKTREDQHFNRGLDDKQILL